MFLWFNFWNILNLCILNTNRWIAIIKFGGHHASKFGIMYSNGGLIWFNYTHTSLKNLLLYKQVTLTWPLSSRRWLVSLSLSKDTICFIHCVPLAGESGCTWIRPGMCGSALPKIRHNKYIIRLVSRLVNGCVPL